MTSSTKEVDMFEKLRANWRSGWLFISISTLLAPVFIPSFPSSNVIGYATAMMVLLSFPSSLFAAPLMIFMGIALGFPPHTLEGMYVNLVLLFCLGVAQWYWIVPRVFGSASNLQTIGFAVNGSRASFPNPIPDEIVRPFDPEGRSPVERIIEHQHEPKV